MVDIVGNETLASLWDKLARECGDKDFFIFQDREGNVATYSYRAFNELIDQTANMFLSQGVERGEHVAVQMHTCPEFLMCPVRPCQDRRRAGPHERAVSAGRVRVRA